MTHSRYISIIAFSGVLAWLALVLIVLKLSPYESAGLALVFFYITLMIALSCTFTVFGFYFRVWLFKNEIFYQHINIALRQGVILSLIAVFCLVFQMMKVFSWWSGLLLVVIAVLMEFYFSSRDSDVT
jgi:Na+/melibiose symporter-like transporter